MRLLSVVFIAAVAATLASLHCVPGRFVTTTERVLAEADSCFTVGDYLHAKMRYTKVISAYPNSDWAEEAQFRLGYLNVYFSNPFGDWEAALREFTTYQNLYPTGRWIAETNSWLNVLHSLKSYDQGFQSQATQAEKLNMKHTFELRKSIGLGDVLGRCEGKRDSLARALSETEKRLNELQDWIIKNVK